MNDAPTGLPFEDFEKVDIRVGQVTRAELVPKSDKLLKLEVDFGPELGTRTIVAGIGKSYGLARIIGLQVPFVVNLAPRKLMGIESHGMALAYASTAPNGEATVALPQCPGAVLGARLG